ncbi:Putative teichuronic acid biosynthesis glycosyltransferase TuaH [Gemmata sp. SH-PL17]|uniref:glycosyltransferase n=1 Tax=Gemmata sp. SH-PL17 TaxID=1630693 RepID=UPI00078C647E|nr:glycosyltransferase [Gemmata sp. SH-PL17]AMV27735.1 Putative teichuronic acid biosynthesis glycosyltransferase TuaH [Gemmata sp. SH-PL17]
MPTLAVSRPAGSSHTLEHPLHNRDILCFSHDWTGDPLSKTHLMRLLARDNRVLWVNSIGYRTPGLNKADVGRLWKKLQAAREPLREVEKNIFVLNPLAVPAYGLRAARVLNRIWLRQQVRSAMRKLRFSNPINWVFNPAAAVLAGAFGEKTLIYQCVDEYSAFSGVAGSAILDLETQLLKKADLVVVSADKLYETKSPHNRNTVVVRHGVDFNHFRKALDPATVVPPEIASLPKPIIGFFGLIADWVDVELMAEVAKRYPTGSMVVLGKATTDVSALASLPNVHLLGRKPYEQLPAYCKGFDVALNPFRINELTLNANPLKVREYLAAGLQVVATNIPEVAILGTCRIGDTHAEFIQQVDDALKVPGPRAEISEQVRTEGWDARLSEIEHHLGNTLAAKKGSTR